jgi:hypothetical protein
MTPGVGAIDAERPTKIARSAIMSSFKEAAMEPAEEVASAADRLRLANGRQVDEATVARLAPQVAEVVAGLAALEARLAREAEPATVERVDERDW